MECFFQFSLWDSMISEESLISYKYFCFQFSLWDSLGQLTTATIDFLNFQFSLWDSGFCWCWSTCRFLCYTFNSLYEIHHWLWRWIYLSQVKLSILFMRFLFFMRFLGWRIRFSFNSLYEILLQLFQLPILQQYFQFSLWDSNVVTNKSWDNWNKLSILFMRFFENGKLIYNSHETLSILFMRFWSKVRCCKWSEFILSILFMRFHHYSIKFMR